MSRPTLDVDSPRVRAGRGQRLDLTAVVAPDGRAAAQVYPANYWMSLLEIPQGEHSVKEFVLETRGCFSCHQVGTRATRELTKGVGSFASSLDAWDHHVTMGPNGANMGALFKRLGAQRKAFADWSDRIASGAYPEAPPRPTGVARNLVISMWDWALPTSRRSDAAGTDERTPTLNANGLLYGAIQSSDILAVLDPRTNSTTEIRIPSNGPVLHANTPRSPVWGDEKIWRRQADPRSVAMDAKRRVWVASAPPMGASGARASATRTRRSSASSGGPTRRCRARPTCMYRRRRRFRSLFGRRSRRQSRRRLAELAGRPRDLQLRSPQVQGAERPHRHRAALSEAEGGEVPDAAEPPREIGEPSGDPDSASHKSRTLADQG